MSAVISKVIVKILCENQGCLDFQRLDERIRQSFTVADQVLHTVLFDDGKIAIEEGKQKASAVHGISPDSLIVAKTSLRLCQKEAGQCLGCDGLHLCRYFVCGDCRFGIKCKNSHRLDSLYNESILKRCDLHDLTEKQLFQLLLQNDPSLIPEICPHYNKGNGEHGSCKFHTSCKKLHLCQHFFQGDCKFGTACKRLHYIDECGMKILRSRGLSQENIRNIQKIYRNKLIIIGQEEKRSSPAALAFPEKRKPFCESSKSCASSSGATKPAIDADKNEICMYFIRRHCSFKEKCVRVHYHLPYKWQVLHDDGVTWKDLPNNEDIERAYCDPQQATSCTDQQALSSGIFRLLSLQSAAAPDVQSVDFLTMTYKGSPVRRLSTASSISKLPHYMFTTEWLWYWKDDSGIWMQYGEGENADKHASVTSKTLENVYLADGDADIPFSAGKEKYILFFKGEAGSQQMYQQNVKYKTKREVRRRPHFVSAHEVEAKLKSTSPDTSSSSTAENIPPHWDKNALPDFGYKLVLLSRSMKEYTMIEKLFKQTMSHTTISKIQRIQNPSLWKVFQWQQEQMKTRNGGNPVDQKYLFHGTDESVIEAICEQNFDWRVCGLHATLYGKGSYFARDASLSDKYVKMRNRANNKIMFVALVLVGEYTKGNVQYARPPQKGNSKNVYNSCVDNENNPSMYVIFEKHQIYPEYLIEYS